MNNFIELCNAEGWVIDHSGKTPNVLVYDKVFPVTHPAAIHLNLYRTLPDVTLKTKHLIAAHNYLWPQYATTWNYWDDRRFQTLCEDWMYISYAGGANTGKSHSAARQGWLYWLAAPQRRTVLVASTTIQSACSRIWGYITRMGHQLHVPYAYHEQGGAGGNAPRIVWDRKDSIHGMYVVAAGKGATEKAIANWIGKHPEEGLMIILDEATDLDPILLSALPNLESVGIDFKCISLGNSCSKFDLHGALSTPKNGWDSVDPLKDVKWETTQHKGVCLFFSCYESPAIHEPDADKRERLSKIFITQPMINSKEKRYGKHSSAFWRFVLGYWRDDSEDPTVFTKRFLDSYRIDEKAEWSGLYPLRIVGGLDPAFSTGGDCCILRLAVLGQDTSGLIVLDYKKDNLIFRIRVNAFDTRSAEKQVADEVIRILRDYKCKLEDIALDANGVGRALGELIRLTGNCLGSPIKIYSAPGSNRVRSFDVTTRTPLELWNTLKDFVQTDQIRGLDNVTVAQLTSRLVTQKGSKLLLEPKQAYRTRMGAIDTSLAHSPDEADAAALALQVAVIKYGFAAGQTKNKLTVSGTDLEKYLLHVMNGKQDIVKSAWNPEASCQTPLADCVDYFNKGLF